MMSESPCGRDLWIFTLHINERFEYCLRQLVILQIKEHNHGYLFSVTLYCETRNLVTQQVLNLSSFVGIELDCEVIGR